MASRSGGYRIKTNKVRSGPDQAFTLPKGTSAAPIKGKGMGNLPKAKKATSSAKISIARRQQLAGTKNKAKNVKITPREIAIGAAAYLAGSKMTTKAKAKKPKKTKTLAQVEAKARKARDKKAKFERLKKDSRRTGMKPISLLKKKRN